MAGHINRGWTKHAHIPGNPTAKGDQQRRRRSRPLWSSRWSAVPPGSCACDAPPAVETTRSVLGEQAKPAPAPAIVNQISGEGKHENKLAWVSGERRNARSIRESRMPLPTETVYCPNLCRGRKSCARLSPSYRSRSGVARARVAQRSCVAATTITTRCRRGRRATGTVDPFS